MPVLMIAEQPNLDEGTYASMLEPLMPLLRSAKGAAPLKGLSGRFCHQDRLRVYVHQAVLPVRLSRGHRRP
jgi:hypothetical protein